MSTATLCVGLIHSCVRFSTGAEAYEAPRYFVYKRLIRG